MVGARVRSTPPTRANGTVNPFVFIVGCLRSGTTLLRRMVDAHPRLAIIHETQWVPRWFERRVGLTPEGFVTPELIPRLLDFPRFAELRISQSDLERLMETGKPVPYSAFVSGVFDLYGEAQDKRLVGEKSPGYVRYLPTLHALWPETKFVHVIRDGRDVCASVLNWKKAGHNVGRHATWAEDPVSTAAFWWEWHVRLGREAGSSLGPNLYHEVRYEALVSEPKETCEKLCSFLGLPYDEAMVSYQEHKETGSWGRAAKGRWLPPTPGVKERHSRMSVEEVERFEAAAGDLLDELAYPRAFPRPSQGALERAREIRESFRRDVRNRGDRLLEVWKT
jgi:hypothetical protein